MTNNRPIMAITVAAIILSAAGSAQAAPKMLQPLADAPGPEVARILDRPVKQEDILILGSPVKDTHTFIAGGRGSLAVGLLLGPIGVAANVAHANAVNQQRGQTVDALVHNDTLSILKDVRAAADGGPGPDVAPDARAYDLIPAIQLTFSDETHFRVGCSLSASLANAGQKPWHARYWVRLYDTYDTASPTSVDAAQGALPQCLTEANRLFERHARGQMTTSDTATPVEIDGKTVKLKLDNSDYPAHVVVPDPWGAAEWPQKPAASAN